MLSASDKPGKSNHGLFLLSHCHENEAHGAQENEVSFGAELFHAV